MRMFNVKTMAQITRLNPAKSSPHTIVCLAGSNAGQTGGNGFRLPLSPSPLRLSVKRGNYAQDTS